MRPRTSHSYSFAAPLACVIALRAAAQPPVPLAPGTTLFQLDLAGTPLGDAPTVPGSVEGTFAFTISGVPSGIHTFTLTAIYQPNIRLAAGSVTVVVP
jgi:hypothetical protein